MHLAHFLNRGYAWIALIAILWASLVPSLAHGNHLPNASRQVSVDYCAPEGQSSLTIEVQSDDGAGSGGVTYPALFYRASHPLHAWRAAQPRAPPAA